MTELEELKSNHRVVYCKIDVVEETDSGFKTQRSYDGHVISGNYSINADSDVRRTCNLTICLDNPDVNFSESDLYNRCLRVSVGYYSVKNQSIHYYSMGIFVFDKETFTYDVQTNELSLSMSDMITLLDVDHRGAMVGNLEREIRAIDPITGERLSHEQLVLKDMVINLLKDYGLKNYRISDIGVYGKVDQDNYKWDELPYNLDWSCGSAILDVLKNIIGLYPIYEMFFDVEGNLIIQQIPVTDEDQVILNSNDVADLVIKETVNRSIYDVKNVIEVWGKEFNVDKQRFADGIMDVSGAVYNVHFDNYTETGYANDMQVAIKVNANNTSDITYLNINNLGAKPIYDKNGTNLMNRYLSSGKLQKDYTYVFKYSTNIQGFYCLGAYQVHAVAVLVSDNSIDRLPEYKKKYRTDNIEFVVDKESEYTIDKIGEIPKIFHGDKIANLDSQYIALNYAIQKLNQLSRRTTSLELEMLSVPFLDVNQKIQYKPHNENVVKTYITKSISGDLVGGTMNVSLMEFYPTLGID